MDLTSIMKNDSVGQLFSLMERYKELPKPIGEDSYDMGIQSAELAAELAEAAKSATENGLTEKAGRLSREAKLAQAWADVYLTMWEITRAELLAEAMRRSGGKMDTPLRDIFEYDTPLWMQISNLQEGLYADTVNMLSDPEC
jgi:hypothetical protein